jgi:hypothetical protein
VTSAQAHANAVAEHLDANTTKELVERNKLVANDLTKAISDLNQTVQSKPAPTADVVKGKIKNIDALLEEAIRVFSATITRQIKNKVLNNIMYTKAKSLVENSQMQIEWRRSKVAELDSQGHSQPEISRILKVSIGTVNRDLYILRRQAQQKIKRYIDERLPEEYEKCLVGLNAITREAWNTSQQTEDKREKIQALSLAKECYSMKLDLLTNATVVDDAIRFVSQKSKEELKLSANDNEQDKQPKEPDYDEDQDQIEEEQEKEIGETTINQVF